MSKENWQEIGIRESFQNNILRSSSRSANTLAMAYFRTEILSHMDRDIVGDMKKLQLADFVYIPDNNCVLKNRIGSVATLYESALKYDQLRSHPDARVRLALDKVLTLAALID